MGSRRAAGRSGTGVHGVAFVASGVAADELSEDHDEARLAATWMHGPVARRAVRRLGADLGGHNATDFHRPGASTVGHAGGEPPRRPRAAGAVRSRLRPSPGEGERAPEQPVCRGRVRARCEGGEKLFIRQGPRAASHSQWDGNRAATLQIPPSAPPKLIWRPPRHPRKQPVMAAAVMPMVILGGSARAHLGGSAGTCRAVASQAAQP